MNTERRNTERRNITRRKCTYYVRVLDFATHELIGYFADLSSQGFKAELPKPIAVGQNFDLRVDLDGNFSDKAYIEFIARSRWQAPDPTEPSLYNAGFQIVAINPHDNEIFQRVVAQYGSDSVM